MEGRSIISTNGLVFTCLFLILNLVTATYLGNALTNLAPLDAVTLCFSKVSHLVDILRMQLNMIKRELGEGNH